MQNKGLTTRIILSEIEEANDDTCIMASDLTEEGLALVRKSYGRWTDSIVDKKKAPNDFDILDKALQKIREEKK